MVSSVDGFIAKADNSISWFDTTSNYEKGMSFENPEKFLQAIDCYVMGARTYEHALQLSPAYGWPYGDTPTIVVTHRDLPAERKNIEFYAGDLATLVNQRLKPNFKNVWLVGGAALVKDFLQARLADEIIVTVLPIILGDGLLFFDRVQQEQVLQVKDVIAYKNGMVELRYAIAK